MVLEKGVFCSTQQIRLLPSAKKSTRIHATPSKVRRAPSMDRDWITGVTEVFKSLKMFG